MAHFALQKLHILPSTLAEMSDREKAFVYASILLRIEEERAKSKFKVGNRNIRPRRRRR